MEPEESMACPVCGGELQPHIICPFCGTDITLKSLEGLEPTYKCPVCGKEAQTKFICNECGSEFKYDLIVKKMGEIKPSKKVTEKPMEKKSSPKKESLVELRGGLTNGLGLKNGKEKGLTNGLTNGLTKEKGLTNGLKGGMVNGSGVTNGTKPSPKPSVKKKASRVPAIAAAIIALILIAGALYVMYLPQKGVIRIDGDFSDWQESMMRDEFKAAVNPLDMVKYASKVEDGGLYIYLQSKESFFSESGNRIYAFVDADNNAATGYRINGIGADYLCKVYGEDGEIGPHGAYVYSGSGFDWNWSAFGSLFVAGQGNQIEMAFYPESISKDYRIAFYTSDSHGNYEVSSVNIGAKPSIYFETERYSGAKDIYPMNGSEVPIMDVGIFATGGNASIKSISITYSGFTDIILKDSHGNAVSTAREGRLAVNQGIKSGERLTYQIWGTLPRSGSRPNGTLLSLSVTQLIVSPSDAILRVKSEPFRAYLGHPSGIIIDGAFGDWTEPKTDPKDSALPAHIDIRSYDGKNDTRNLYFYLGVRKDIMAGVLVPERYVEGMPNQNITHISPTPTGEDVLRIHINADGKRYYVEILGKEGKILSSKLYHWDGQRWMEINSPGIEVKKDSNRMEGSVSLNMLGNPSTMKIWFEMSDWEGHSDLTDKISPEEMQKEYTRNLGSDIEPVPEFSNMVWAVLITAIVGTTVLRKKKRK